MIPFLLIIIIIITICLLSTLFIYTLIHSRENFKLSTINEKQKIKYSIQPSIDIITKKLQDELPRRLSISSHRRCSSIRNSTEEKKINLINPNPSALRSHSLANNLCVLKPMNRRRSSIVDSNHIAQIEFSLPPTKEKYRRRSVAICNNIIDCKQSTIDSIIKTIKSSNQFLPCLLSFSITYLKSSQIKIHFHSLISLPSTIHLQQLTIKVKLIPDGKIKYLYLKKITNNENIFSGGGDDDTNEYFIRFSNISSAKLHDKAILMKIYGKDQSKKTINFGQIGKIHLNQINNWENENQIDFIHEIEKIKTSSAAILVSLEQNNDHNLIVDIQGIKGLKVDQKNLNATYYFRVILLDRHRPLSTHQTKSYRLNSSTCSFDEPIDFNILAFNSNNLDRLMIIINLYSNSNNTNEHRCIARVKLASPYFCSGNGTNHWQQFKERKSFSMWHTLIKQQ